MAKIHSIKISNYRGIQKYEQVFGMSDFICLIGNGGSGKSSILNAISVVLSPSSSLSFSDTDFYKEDTTNPIAIEVSFLKLPLKDEHASILTIKLIVEKELIPKWYILSDGYSKELIEIANIDREIPKAYFLSVDDNRNYFLNKGKGLKREISEASLIELVKIGGIFLIDDIELSHNPENLQCLLKTLRKNNKGQIFISNRNDNHIWNEYYHLFFVVDIKSTGC